VLALAGKARPAAGRECAWSGRSPASLSRRRTGAGPVCTFETAAGERFSLLGSARPGCAARAGVA
jgi:hypothetical protein